MFVSVRRVVPGMLMSIGRGTGAHLAAEGACEMTTVVLIDDNRDMRALVRDVLEDYGYTVQETPNDATALSLLRDRPDAVIAIFGMTTGTTLLQAAVEEPPLRRHAFVLLTATPDFLTPLWRVLLAALDVPVVAKPFALDTLLAVLVRAGARIGQPDGNPIPA